MKNRAFRHLLTFLFLLPIVDARAQSSGEVADAELSAQVSASVGAVVRAREAVDADRKTLQAGTADLEKARAAATEAVPALPADPFAPAGIPPDQVESLSRAWDEFAAVLQRRRQAAAEWKTHLDGRLALLTAATEKAKALQEAAATARPLLVEFRRRVEAGALADDVIAVGDVKRPAAEWLTDVESARADFAAWAAGLPDEIARLQAEADKIPAAMEETKPAEARARRCGEALRLFAHSLQAEKNEAGELAKLEPAGLPGAIARWTEDWKTDTDALAKQGKRSQELLQGIAEIDRRRSELAAPVKEEVAEGDGHPELREARKNHGFSNAMLEYHRKRLALLAESREAARGRLAALQESVEFFDRALRAAVRLRAALAHAETLRAEGKLEIAPPPVDVTPASLWIQVCALATEEADRRLAAQALEAHLADTTAEDSAKQTLQAEEVENRRLQGALQEELTYAGFLEDMGSRSEKELLDLLSPKGEIATRLTEAQKEAASAEATLTTTEQKTRSLRDQVRSIENPYVEMGLRQAAARAQQILEELEGIQKAKDGRIPEDRSARPLAINGPAPATLPAETAGETEEDPTLREKRILEQEQAFAKELLRYYTDLERSTLEWRRSLADVAAAVAAWAARYTALIQEQKRRYACARELERRYGAGRISRSRLPADLAKWSARDEIQASAKARDEAMRRHETTRARREADLQALDVLLSLKSLAETRSTLADRKAGTIARPASHLAAARTPYEDLPEVERQNLVYRAERRRSGDNGIWDGPFSTFLESEARDRFEKPLEVFYLETVNRERVLQELSAAARHYEELVELCGREREEIATAPQSLQEGTDLRLQGYHTARYVAAIAAAPDLQAQIETAYRTAFRRELALPADSRNWDLRHWSDDLFAAEGRLWGHLRWVQDARKRLSKLGVEADIGRYRRNLARIVAAQTGEQEHLRKVAGEIADLRLDFRRQVRWATCFAFAQVLFIPIIAWFVLRIVRRFARRLEQGTGEGSPADAEYARRLSTLARVSSAAVAAAVWIITGIYILGRLGINITPILASAGVLGLAVAFGAQTLIKDFLSGFFILLENQYRIGDVIVIDGVGGVVERITLRVTVLRDLQGTVHYIPNGTMARISNMTQGWSRVVLEVGVSYSENLDRVIRVLKDLLAQLKADPAWGPALLDEPEVSGVESLGESSIDVRVLVKTRPMKQWDVARELRKRIKARFDQEGIEIPFPQRVVHHVHQNADGASPVAPEAAAAAQSRALAEITATDPESAPARGNKRHEEEERAAVVPERAASGRSRESNRRRRR